MRVPLRYASLITVEFGRKRETERERERGRESERERKKE